MYLYMYFYNIFICIIYIYIYIFRCLIIYIHMFVSYYHPPKPIRNLLTLGKCVFSAVEGEGLCQ